MIRISNELPEYSNSSFSGDTAPGVMRTLRERQRADIYAAIQSASAPVTYHQVAALTNYPYATTRRRMLELVQEDKIIVDERRTDGLTFRSADKTPAMPLKWVIVDEPFEYFKYLINNLGPVEVGKEFNWGEQSQIRVSIDRAKDLMANIGAFAYWAKQVGRLEAQDENYIGAAYKNSEYLNLASVRKRLTSLEENFRRASLLLQKLLSYSPLWEEEGLLRLYKATTSPTPEIFEALAQRANYIALKRAAEGGVE